MYDRAAQYWQLLRMVLVPVAAGLGKRQKHMWGLFYAAQQRFFRWGGERTVSIGVPVLPLCPSTQYCKEQAVV
jgi:hypothetical protein